VLYFAELEKLAEKTAPIRNGISYTNTIKDVENCKIKTSDLNINAIKAYKIVDEKIKFN
jgi:hypothetical protein